MFPLPVLLTRGPRMMQALFTSRMCCIRRLPSLSLALTQVCACRALLVLNIATVVFKNIVSLRSSLSASISNKLGIGIVTFNAQCSYIVITNSSRHCRTSIQQANLSLCTQTHISRASIPHCLSCTLNIMVSTEELIAPYYTDFNRSSSHAS